MLGLMLSTYILLYKYLQGLRDSWLKNFERKIIIEDLSTDEIKKFLQKSLLVAQLLNG